MSSKIFPDGTAIDEWFYDTRIPELWELGKKYILTDYNIFNDGKLYTKEIQNLIDLVSQEGGGVIVVPAGIYCTGAIYLKQGVNLYLQEGATLKGSDDISDYNICTTRIEGETCKYYDALINGDNLEGTYILGTGTIDGNGMRAWRAFWQRRAWNPECTNKDEQRPRLIYFSNCKNIMVANVHLINSHFWTNHIYKCNHVKYLNCYIYSPAKPVKAPSTDAIDIDVCSDVLIKGCYMEVNDDSVVLKGGKGPWADEDENNGSNERILVEDCEYGFCHGCLTCGSESVHNKNILVRRIKVATGTNLLWLKMRPDTPQKYEYITVEDVEGKIRNFLTLRPWTQFYDLKGRKDTPLSIGSHITMKNCKCECEEFFNVGIDENTKISDVLLENLEINAVKNNYNAAGIENIKCSNVNVKLALKEYKD